MQRHTFSVELNAPPADVWEVFWYRAPDRPQPKDVSTRIEILHPGDDVGNGLVRHCYFPVPKWLLSRGVGQSWEWLTEVKPYESWRYDAVGKPLWSRASGWTTLTDLGDGRTRVTFTEEYEAFNPIMRALFEKRVHESLSRDNDTIHAAHEGGLKWHPPPHRHDPRRTRRRTEVAPAPQGAGAPGRTAVKLFVYGTLMPGFEAWDVLAVWSVGEPRVDAVRGALFDTGRGYPCATFDAADELVHGVVVDLDPARAEAALAEIDAYEASEYDRVVVTTVGGEEAYTYAWVAPLGGCVAVPGGRWA